MKIMRLSDSGQPPVLVEEDVPQPQPRRGELLVRVYAAGVTSRTDAVEQGGTVARRGRAGDWSLDLTLARSGLM